MSLQLSVIIGELRPSQLFTPNCRIPIKPVSLRDVPDFRKLANPIPKPIYGPQTTSRDSTQQAIEAAVSSAAGAVIQPEYVRLGSGVFAA